MTGAEFVVLLKGLSSETPLGRIVSIRAETDKETIKGFGPGERRIRREWAQKQSKKKNAAEVQGAMEQFKQIFISMGKDR